MPFSAKVATVGVLLCALIAGGWAAASGVTPSSGGNSGSLVLETTVQRLATVREQGRMVRKLVPVAVTIKTRQRRETIYQTQPKYITVAPPASGDARAHTVTKLIPSVTTREVTINGKPSPATSAPPITSGQPGTATVTRTVTTQNVTQPAVTIARTETDTVTRTETLTSTTTRTVTQPVTETQTVTLPPQTVTIVQTVTVTTPKPK